ncbi:MAG: carboxy terminal-processing peptidase, partial [Pseudomonadota bacterium]
KTLDPNKVFFTQADIDAFEPYRYKLDDLLKKRNAEVAFDIFKVFRQRMSERTKLIMSLIESDFDFSKDETFNIDSDSFTWAKTEAELNEVWRKRIKNDTLLQMMKGSAIDDLTKTSDSRDKNDNAGETKLIEEIRENLTRRYQRQKDTIFQLKADEVFEWFMNSYTRELGPHTVYMSHATTENFLISMSLSLEGIGAALQTEEDYTVINRIIKGGPAEKSGQIEPEDKIVGVAQEGESNVNVIGWRLMDVVQIIRGKKGTKVTLQIIPGGSAPGATPEEITLVRDVIELEDQAAKMTSVDIPFGESKKKFSVISIPSFYSNEGQAKNGAKFTSTTHDVRKLIDDMKKQGDSEGLVIDLRGNGGGYLNEAVSLSGLFIEQGPIVQVIPSNRKTEVLNDLDSSIAYDGPLVVLIDRFSASASEIFAAAMQDYGRAIIVGERSFGKGTVQRVAPLRSNFRLLGGTPEHNSQVKFTNAQFFRVNGGSTQHKGVTPDILLNSGVEDEEFGERSYDNALPWSQTKPANYPAKSFATKLVADLSSQHLNRSNKSPAFELLRKNSARIAENRNIKELSLNIKERQADRDRREQESIDNLNAYRKSLGLEAVTSETRKDNPLPGKDEHWDNVYQTEAAYILFDQINWAETSVTSIDHQK